MAGSEATEDLQRAWVAAIMAIQDVLGFVKNGNCFLVAMTARPLVEHVLGEPVQPCAGYAGFVERTGRQVRHALAPPKSGTKWVDANAGAHVSFWRNAKALDAVEPLAPMVLPLVTPFEIYAELKEA
jgi:hypothetical protein